MRAAAAALERAYRDERAAVRATLTRRLDGDPGRLIAVICASGQRAATAASLIQRHGGREVLHVVDGGVPGWERMGGSLEAVSLRVVT